MSSPSMDHSDFSDASIVSLIRRPPVRHGSPLSLPGSIHSLPIPTSIHSGSIGNKLIGSDSGSGRSVTGSSNRSMKTAKSYLSMISKFSAEFPDEYFYETDSSNPSGENDILENNESLSGEQQLSPMSGSSSGVTIFSDAHEEHHFSPNDNDVGNSPYIRQSINWSRRNTNSQGLVNTSRLLQSSLSSSMILPDVDVATPISPQGMIYDSNETNNMLDHVDTLSSPHHGIGTTRTGSNAMAGTGALAASTSSMLSPSTPSKRRVAARSNENTPSAKTQQTNNTLRSSTAAIPLKPLDTNSVADRKSRLKLSLGRPISYGSASRPGSLLNSIGPNEDMSRNANIYMETPTSHSIGIQTEQKEAAKMQHSRQSQIRRSGSMLLHNGHAYSVRSGLPRLPNFPSMTQKSHSDIFPEVKDEDKKVKSVRADLEAQYRKKFDEWGRTEASPIKAAFCISACVLFPPLWLFVGAGYFDNILGPLPRWAKIVALLLTVITLAAGTALVIVFSLVSISYT